MRNIAPHHQAQIISEHRRTQEKRIQRHIIRHSALNTNIPVTVPSQHLRTGPELQVIRDGIIFTPGPEEVGLHALSDGMPGQKPPYTYAIIVRCAILGSPRQRLTLSEIYLAMITRFPWFKTAGQSWKVCLSGKI